MTKRKQGSTTRTHKPLVIGRESCRAARRNTLRKAQALRDGWIISGRLKILERYEPYARSPSKHERKLDLLRVGIDPIHELVVDLFANRDPIPSIGHSTTGPYAWTGSNKAKEAA